MLRHAYIDPDRVILTGLSMGGGGVYSIGKANPSMFAGLSPICASGQRRLELEVVCEKLADMPMWIAHGLDDECIPCSASVHTVAALRGAGNSRIVFDSFAAGHDSWSQTYSDPAWWAWVRSRRRNSRHCDEAIRITYRSSWQPAYLAFRADKNEWVSAVPLSVAEGNASSSASLSVLRSSAFNAGAGAMRPFEALAAQPGWQTVCVPASTLEFCTSDSRGAWDNPAGGGNYVALQPGHYTLEDGKVTQTSSQPGGVS